MSRILWIGNDTKLQHPGTRDNPLDQFDLGLVDLRHDDLNLVEAILANRYLFLATGIDSATDSSDQLVHADAIFGLLLRIDLIDQDHAPL